MFSDIHRSDAVREFFQTKLETAVKKIMEQIRAEVAQRIALHNTMVEFLSASEIEDVQKWREGRLEELPFSLHGKYCRLRQQDWENRAMGGFSRIIADVATEGFLLCEIITDSHNTPQEALKILNWYINTSFVQDNR